MIYEVVNMLEIFHHIEGFVWIGFQILKMVLNAIFTLKGKKILNFAMISTWTEHLIYGVTNFTKFILMVLHTLKI